MDALPKIEGYLTNINHEGKVSLYLLKALAKAAFEHGVHHAAAMAVGGDQTKTAGEKGDKVQELIKTLYQLLNTDVVLSNDDDHIIRWVLGE